MTTILYPGMRRARDPEVTAQIAQRFGPSAKQAPAVAPTAVSRPRVPWRHNALFREPAYTDGQPYADDEDPDDE